jgi:hypothetical protein
MELQNDASACSKCLPAALRERRTQHIYGMVDRGEHDEQRLTVGGLVYLKAVERDHKIKSAQDASVRRPKEKAST